MTNYEYCKGNPEALRALWRKREKLGLSFKPEYERLCGGGKCPDLDQLIWTTLPCDLALDFDIGDLVQSCTTGKYFQIVSYDSTFEAAPGLGRYRVYDKFLLVGENGSNVVYPATGFRKADIPIGVMALARAKLVSEIKCPLMRE